MLVKKRFGYLCFQPTPIGRGGILVHGRPGQWIIGGKGIMIKIEFRLHLPIIFKDMIVGEIDVSPGIHRMKAWIVKNGIEGSGRNFFVATDKSGLQGKILPGKGSEQAVKLITIPSAGHSTVIGG